MDGLLFDTEQVYLEESINGAKDYGLELDKEYYLNLHGLSDQEVKERYYADYSEYTKEYLDEVMAHTYKRVTKRVKEGNIPLKFGAIELLDFLKARDIPMTIASNNYRYMIEHLLACNNLAEYFCGIVSADDVNHGKPNPEIVEKALDILKIKKDKVVMFEDSLNGIRAAYAADVAAIMIPDLMEPNAEAVAKTFAQCINLSEAKKYFN